GAAPGPPGQGAGVLASSFPGWCVSTRPGISRFPGAQLRTIVRCSASPRNDCRHVAGFAGHMTPIIFRSAELERAAAGKTEAAHVVLLSLAAKCVYGGPHDTPPSANRKGREACV